MKAWRVNLWLFSVVLICSAGAGPSSAQPRGQTDSESASRLIVACSPEKPIVRLGETVKLHAFADARSNETLRYDWSAPAGRLDGQGREVRWHFTDILPGIHVAKVRVADGKDMVECSARVIVQSGRSLPRRGGRETGRSFLLPEQIEAAGYGLYSYLLLGSRPTASNRERYLKAVEEFLRFPDIDRFDDFQIPRRALNITYLPLQTSPDAFVLDQVADEHYGKAAEWFLRRYDYARARLLLRSVDGNPRQGPYFISALKPYSGKNSAGRPYLLQDQSSVPPHLVSLWAGEFLNQAAQEDFWQERTAAQLVLKLRTSVGILATGLPEVQTALGSLIAWVS